MYVCIYINIIRRYNIFSYAIEIMVIIRIKAHLLNMNNKTRLENNKYIMFMS